MQIIVRPPDASCFRIDKHCFADVLSSPLSEKKKIEIKFQEYKIVDLHIDKLSDIRDKMMRKKKKGRGKLISGSM